MKLGDGAADIKPIAHLYKTQVYALAEHLGVPESVRSRPSTTDTYSLPQSQEEFYFSLPHQRMDLCLYGKNNGVPVDEIAEAADLTVEQVERVFRDIDQKTTRTAADCRNPVGGDGGADPRGERPAPLLDTSTGSNQRLSNRSPYRSSKSRDPRDAGHVDADPDQRQRRRLGDHANQLGRRRASPARSGDRGRRPGRH